MKKKIVICLLFLVILLMGRGLFATGRDTAYRKPVWLSARYAYGFILPHHKSMERFTRNHVSLYEVAVSFNSEFSDKINGFHFNSGTSYLYSSLSDTRILGDVHAVVPWIRQAYRINAFSFSFRLGLGLAWVTHPFDLETNFQNTAIGSHLNAAILINSGLNFKPDDRWVWSAGLNFIHFSNGSTKQPNYGINLPLIYAGISYNLVKQQGIRPAIKIDSVTGRFYIGLQAAGGIKQIFPVNGPDYFTMLAAPYAGYRFTHGFSGLLAFDISYSASDIDYLKSKGLIVTSKNDVIKTGLSLGFNQNYGPLGLSFRFGYYFHQLEDSDGPFYDVLSLSYRLLKGLDGRIMLKTHFARADFVGAGFSYTFDF